MLSILIPTYQYNVYPLVAELQKQAEELAISYEILVFDDGSEIKTKENQAISELQNCRYYELEQNIGRSAIRNLLAKQAQYSHLLFLDADVFPKNTDFIKNYIRFINDNSTYQLVYGGICYQTDKPNPKELLRWVYGNHREALPVEKRKSAPNLSFLTLNFLIKKEIFDEVVFNEQIPNVRYEDVLFSYDLKQKNKVPEHIDNPVIHHGLETSERFIEKTHQSLEGLIYLIDNNYLPVSYVRISAFFHRIKKIKMDKVYLLFFRLFRKQMLRNLKGKSPNMYLFDFYRLGFFIEKESTL